MRNFIPLRLNSNQVIKFGPLNQKFGNLFGGPMEDVIHNADGTCTVYHDNGTHTDGHTVHNGSYTYCCDLAGHPIHA